MAEANNLLDIAKKNLDSIAQFLESDYSDKKRLHKILNAIKRPQNILKKKLILKLVNGKKKVFQSFRVQHNDSNGPFFGGTRYSSDISEEQIKALAIQESIKSSVAGLPFGGSFGGVIVNPKSSNKKDLERLTKLYSQFLCNHIGPWRDVLTVEVGTSVETMNWMMEAYEKKKKFHSPATFNGNNFNLDGAVYFLNKYLKSSNTLPIFRKIDVAIHGFGNRSFTFAKNLNSQNFRIVAISDKSGGLVNSNGFDINELKKLKDKFSTLKEVSVMQKIEYIDNKKILELPVDILVVASKDKVVTKDVAEVISSRLVLELSNFGITNDGFEILSRKEIDVLPDILLNAGYSIISHIEWVQKMHGYRWSKEEVSKRLQTGILKMFADVEKVVTERNISYKDAGYYLGLKGIIEMMISRGRV